MSLVKSHWIVVADPDLRKRFLIIQIDSTMCQQRSFRYDQRSKTFEPGPGCTENKDHALEQQLQIS